MNEIPSVVVIMMNTQFCTDLNTSGSFGSFASLSDLLPETLLQTDGQVCTLNKVSGKRVDVATLHGRGPRGSAFFTVVPFPKKYY
ncbi:hypothetical protein PsorP6_011108 [Peronosclerospora sorghi]|uniref:Uncharacterized protein n=1 Tax=Peronosclerospora sorghi TaxID=230839 RepID=A0ACC0VZM7_9STRA|nr:hypothetical protein PsorP6_011108 [Peronosclerospora sorghi]